MTTGLGQNCVTRGRGPLEIPFCKPQIGAKTETWLENSWRRSDNIVGDLEENYDLSTHDPFAAWGRGHQVQRRRGPRVPNAYEATASLGPSSRGEAGALVD
jgi:hypothetical protein